MTPTSLTGPSQGSHQRALRQIAQAGGQRPCWNARPLLLRNHPNLGAAGSGSAACLGPAPPTGHFSSAAKLLFAPRWGHRLWEIGSRARVQALKPSVNKRARQSPQGSRTFPACKAERWGHWVWPPWGRRQGYSCQGGTCPRAWDNLSTTPGRHTSMRGERQTCPGPGGVGQCLPSPGRLAGPGQGRGSLNLTPFLGSKIEGPSVLTSRGSIHRHLLHGSPAQSHGEHKEPPTQVSEQRGLCSGPGQWLFCGCSDVSVDRGREYLLLGSVIQIPSTLHPSLFPEHLLCA